MLAGHSIGEEGNSHGVRRRFVSHRIGDCFLGGLCGSGRSSGDFVVVGRWIGGHCGGGPCCTVEVVLVVILWWLFVVIVVEVVANAIVVVIIVIVVVVIMVNVVMVVVVVVVVVVLACGRRSYCWYFRKSQLIKAFVLLEKGWKKQSLVSTGMSDKLGKF